MVHNKTNRCVRSGLVEPIGDSIKRLCCLSDDQYHNWLRTPNKKFGGKTPQQEIDSGNMERFRGMIHDLESGDLA